MDAEDTDGAITVGNEIIKLNPGDGEAEEMMKRASVSVAMTKGNWENSTDFRTQLKDQEEAQSLEQSSKIVNDKKSLEDLIRSTYSLVQKEPENLNHYLQLSDLYHRYGDSKMRLHGFSKHGPKKAARAMFPWKKKSEPLPWNIMTT